MTGRSYRRQGFTLLEVLVAITVLSIISLVGWQTLASTTDVRTFLEDEQTHAREIDAALTRLERLISLSFLTPSIQAVNTYQTVFIGQDESDMDRLFLATKAHVRTIRNARECDQAEVTLWTEPDPETAGTYILYYRESGRIDHEPDIGGIIRPLLTGVTRFDLRYLDPENGEWRDDWDSTGAETPNRLPRAVQLVVSLQRTDSYDPDEIIVRPYVRTIMLETAPEITQSLLSGGQGSSSGAGLGFGGLSR